MLEMFVPSYHVYLCACVYVCGQAKKVRAQLLFLSAVLLPSSLTIRREDESRRRLKSQETKLETIPNCEAW